MIYKSYLLEQNINLLKSDITLFYGENLGLKNNFKFQIKKFNKETKFFFFHQEDILKNINNFFNQINNNSLFEKEKIFLIEDVNDKILDVIEEIFNMGRQQKIYLFSDILERKSKIRSYFEKSKNCGIVPCYADNEITLKKIILNKLVGFEGLTPFNINLIIESINLDRAKLYNELNKIIIYFKEKKIEKDKLEILLNTKFNDDFNILKDYALNGDKIKTNKLLSDTVIDGDKNIFYLTLINQRLNKLLEAIFMSNNSNLEEAVSQIKPPIFWKDKPNFILQIKKWNSNKINFFLKKTYNLEIEIKSNSNVEKNTLIKKLIVDMCELANA
jgi:DNA polymerase III subunit delta